MRRDGYTRLFVASLVSLAVFAGVAAAAPVPNGAVLFPRTFNDCPFTVLSSTNAYPGLIEFDESNLVCPGGQNMHVWNFSADGGLTPMIIGNTDDFRMGSTVELIMQGTVAIEGGLLISPWWSPNTDGYFNIRLPDGEIACFGGVLPFYSFTGAFGIRYAGGPIGLEVLYRSNCLTEANPGTVVYMVHYQGADYVSPPLPFGCNPVEEPLHGCWGIRDNVHVGGRVANLMFNGGPNADPAATNIGRFMDSFFEPLPHDCAVPAKASTWGTVKATYR